MNKNRVTRGMCYTYKLKMSKKKKKKNKSQKRKSKISTLNFQNFTIAITVNNFDTKIFDISCTNIEKNFKNSYLFFFLKIIICIIYNLILK